MELNQRDLIGYADNGPNISWPGGKRVAINFVINYEEGGENSVLNGDSQSELFLNETPNGYPRQGCRDLAIESQYEYGSRCGFWRLLRLFNTNKFPITCFAVGKAIEANPAIVSVLESSGHEIASHSYRWIDYQHVSPAVEEEHIRKSIMAIKNASPSGKAPVGWYTGRVSPNTRFLVSKVYKELQLPLLYDSDAYNDDLPYWVAAPRYPSYGFPAKDIFKPDASPEKGLLVVPYTLDQNDMKFCVPPGFTSPSGFFEYLCDSLDTLLYEAQQHDKSSFLSVGLHCRLGGKPGRFQAIRKFVEYVSTQKDHVWVATREQVAEHFSKQVPFAPSKKHV